MLVLIHPQDLSFPGHDAAASPGTGESARSIPSENKPSWTECESVAMGDAPAIAPWTAPLFFPGSAGMEVLIAGSVKAPLPVTTSIGVPVAPLGAVGCKPVCRSEEHTSELQSLRHLVCRL